MSRLTHSVAINQATPVIRLLGRHIQHELLLVAWAVMEVSLIAPIFLALTRWAAFWSPVATAFWMLLILLLSFNLVRLMSLLAIAPNRQRNLVVAALLLVVLTTLPTLLYVPRSVLDFDWIPLFLANFADTDSAFWSRDLAVFLVTFLLWWRGIRLSHQALSIERAGLRLRLGGLIGTPLVAWLGRRLEWDVTPFVLLFFFASTMVIALSRAEGIEQGRSGRSASLNPRWLTGIAAASFGVVIASGVIASIVNDGLATSLIAWLYPLWRAVAFAVAIVTNTVIYLCQPLFWLLGLLTEWLSVLLSKFLGSLDFEAWTLPEANVPLPQATAEAAERVEPLFAGGRAIVVLVMLALVLVIGLTLRRAYRQSTPALNGDDRFEKEAKPAMHKSDNLARRWLRRLGLLRRRRFAASIRRIYREMSEAASASGYPRAMSETPLEYLESLGQVWPNNRDDSRNITNAYIRVRYGALPETKEELEEISAAWERLEQTKPQSLSSRTVYAELE